MLHETCTNVQDKRTHAAIACIYINKTVDVLVPRASKGKIQHIHQAYLQTIFHFSNPVVSGVTLAEYIVVTF